MRMTPIRISMNIRFLKAAKYDRRALKFDHFHACVWRIFLNGNSRIDIPVRRLPPSPSTLSAPNSAERIGLGDFVEGRAKYLP